MKYSACCDQPIAGKVGKIIARVEQGRHACSRNATKELNTQQQETLNHQPDQLTLNNLLDHFPILENSMET